MRGGSYLSSLELLKNEGWLAEVDSWGEVLLTPPVQLHRLIPRDIDTKNSCNVITALVLGDTEIFVSKERVNVAAKLLDVIDSSSIYSIVRSATHHRSRLASMSEVDMRAKIFKILELPMEKL